MRVLLTGGSGFIGAHIVAQLLQNRHSVVFTARTTEKGERILSDHPQASPQTLSYAIVADIAQEAAFDNAVVSDPPFDAVIHTAAPYYFHVTDRQKDILDPAVLGTTGLLKAIAQHAPTVKRVVLASSFSALVNVQAHPSVYDGSSWNPVTLAEALQGDLQTLWRGSKTLAERAAWEFVERERPRFQLATLNPPLVFGPMVHHPSSLNAVNTSNQRIRDMLVGEMQRGLAPTGIFIWVDVRDLALAHVRAVEVPEAGGKRFLCTAGFYSNAGIADAIKKGFPDAAARLPERYESDLDLSRKPFEIDSGMSRELLGVRYRSLEESITDTVRSMLMLEA